MRTALIVIVAVCACDDPKPAATPDPWATAPSAPSAATRTDPWATGASEPAPAVASTPAPASPGLPEGEWKCDLVGTTWMNGQRYTQTTSLNGFAIHGNAFTSEREGSGTVEVEGSYATFHGGGFDNWRGAFNTHKNGSLYLVFGGNNHRDAQPGHGSHINDIQCEPR